jgi:hypothetical protein
MDHLNAGQRKMTATMVYPEVKHGGCASAPADLPIAGVVAITVDHRAAGAGPVLPKLFTPTAVRALTTVRRRLAPADFLMSTGQKASACAICRGSG